MFKKDVFLPQIQVCCRGDLELQGNEIYNHIRTIFKITQGMGGVFSSSHAILPVI